MLGFSTNEKIKTIEAAHKTLKLIEESRKCELERGPRGIKKIKGFDKNDMLKKAEKDAIFFEHLFNEFIDSKNENVKNAYDKLITEAMVYVGQLLQEADVAPVTVSPVVDNEVLSEEEILNYYKRSFNLILEQKFNKPNIKSELLFEDVQNGCAVKRILAPGVKGLLIKCAKTGILDQNDPEAVAKYLSAEQAVRDAISNILIPERIFKQIEDYKENLPEGYVDIFGNALADKIEAFKKSVAKIAAIVAPFIFVKALKDAGIDVPFNPAQVAGLGIDADQNDE